MAVTLPPPSEQVFTRFFILLDPDVILASNYPPAVPYHGKYYGYEGIIRFCSVFAENVNWTNFRLEGLNLSFSNTIFSR